MSDEELAKKGDKEAFKRIIEENKKYLFNIAISILGNEEDAGDAIGETIIKAYENIKNLREPKFFKTWITRILINESKKILILRGKVISIEEYKQEQISNYQYKENIDLKNALTKLSKEHYDVIMLFYYNDLKINEIAQILNIPEGTVKSRLSNAKNKLYQELTIGEESEING